MIQDLIFAFLFNEWDFKRRLKTSGSSNGEAEDVGK